MFVSPDLYSKKIDFNRLCEMCSRRLYASLHIILPFIMEIHTFIMLYDRGQNKVSVSYLSTIVHTYIVLFKSLPEKVCVLIDSFERTFSL